MYQLKLKSLTRRRLDFKLRKFRRIMGLRWKSFKSFAKTFTKQKVSQVRRAYRRFIRQWAVSHPNNNVYGKSKVKPRPLSGLKLHYETTPIKK